MSSNEDQPRLVELGANTRGAPSKINMDVSGTVGPDYLGQETVDVDGHSNDRPGVRYRLPENQPDHPEVARMDTGEELPVLLSSNMRADPIEGTQGSYTEIVEGECNRCGYDRIRVSAHTINGEGRRQCNACTAIQDPRADNGYRMPKTDKERAKDARESGEVLVENHVRDLVKQNSHDARLVGRKSSTYIPIDVIEEYFWALVENDDIDLKESIESNTRRLERGVLGTALLPEGITIEADDDFTIEDD